MFCSNCGYQNQGGMFCKQCGIKLDNTDHPTQKTTQTNSNQFIQPQQNMNNQQQNINPKVSNNYFNNITLNKNYVDNAVKPNMKKWAILSVIVPVVAIVWYWFIGLSFYIAIALAASGFGFAQKGEMFNKKLAVIGKTLNGILAGMAIIMFILQLITNFNS